jgi:hypothetical protein
MDLFELMIFTTAVSVAETLEKRGRNSHACFVACWLARTLRPCSSAAVRTIFFWTILPLVKAALSLRREVDCAAEA